MPGTFKPHDGPDIPNNTMNAEVKKANPVVQTGTQSTTAKPKRKPKAGKTKPASAGE